MLTIIKDLHQRLLAAIERHEEQKIELNRQELLDLTDMTLPELQREHFSVTRRLTEKRYDPEGLELLQERENNLLRRIKQVRRTR